MLIILLNAWAFSFLGKFDNLILIWRPTLNIVRDIGTNDGCFC
jgi:hypothetical protein